MELNLTPQENNHYYVYLVKNEQGGILYASADKLTDIITFRKLTPNPQFDVTLHYTLEILTAHVHYYDAINVVSRLIKDLVGTQPPLNITNHLKHVANVQCIESGVVYRNASQACKALQISPPRLSMHLRQRPGHKAIKGMTFRYVKGDQGIGF